MPLRRPTRCLLGSLALAAALCLGWLVFGAGWLVVDEADEGAVASGRMYAVVRGGDGRFDVAAELYQSGAVQGVLLIEWRPLRLVAHGVLPSGEEVGRRELGARGVPAESVGVVLGEARTDWEAARLLGGWLEERPETRVVVLCDRFASRRQRRIVDAVLEPAEAGRVFVKALPDRRYDETDWWRSRRGVKAFAFSWFSLVSLHLLGEVPPVEEEWDPDAYEAELGVRGVEG